MTYKAVKGIAPSCITDLISTYKPKRNFRSSNRNDLVKPSYNLKSYGFRSFSHAAPMFRNSLPQDIKSSESVNSFKKSVKIFLFKKAFGL